VASPVTDSSESNSLWRLPDRGSFTWRGSGSTGVARRDTHQCGAHQRDLDRHGWSWRERILRDADRATPGAWTVSPPWGTHITVRWRL